VLKNNRQSMLDTRYLATTSGASTCDDFLTQGALD